MSSFGLSSATSKQFSWSQVASGKISTRGRTFNPSHKVSKRLSDSSCSLSDTDSDKATGGFRQHELLLSAAKQSCKDQKGSGKKNDIKGLAFEPRGWLKSARQRDLIRTGSGSSLQDLRKEHNQSALRRQWPSINKLKNQLGATSVDSLTIKTANLSAGSRELCLKEPNRDSAGSLGRSGSGADLLVEAVRFGRIRHIKLLLDGETDPNSLDSEGVTALIAAVADVGDTSLRNRLIQVLLDAGADPNVGDSEGTTPLMHACSSNYHEAAVILLQCEKTDCGIQDDLGNSALMYAAREGHSNIVLLILAAFKQVHHLTYLGQRNSKNLSACDLAEANGFFDVVCLLKTDSETLPFSNPENRLFFKTHLNDLSRTPTPPDDSASSSEYSNLELINEPTFRPPTPISDLDSLNSYGKPSASQEYFGLINFSENGHSAIDSGNEADTESLMEGDVSLNDTNSEMPSPAVENSCSSLGRAATPIRSPKVSSSTPIKLIVDRNTIDKVQDVIPKPKSSTQILNPLKKIVPVPFGLGSDSTSNGDLISLNRSFNRSIKNLVQQEQDLKPGNRPPTPARPSLPTLTPGGVPIEDLYSMSSSSVESTGKGRRVTIAGLSKSSLDLKALSKSPPQKKSQDGEDASVDLLGISTKSEGWDTLWGPRCKGPLEGHVVPLPPIGQTQELSVSKRERKIATGTNMLKVAKKTLERLDNALATSTERKSRSLSRSRTVENLNTNSFGSSSQISQSDK